ncbi:unnamed protein product [Discosporangium mesarthrocarpum]
MKNIVSNLAPKMLIIAGGSRRAAQGLLAHVRHQLGGDEDAVGAGDEAAATSRYVVVNKAGVPVPVMLDSEAFDVLLHDSLYTQLKWRQLGNYGVAHVECKVDWRGRGPPLLCAKPRGEREGHPAMFLSVGDVNIVQLKKALETAGISVELQAGTLHCDGGITVRIGEGGKMDLEGTVGDEYFRVRDIVYSQYTMI